GGRGISKLPGVNEHCAREMLKHLVHRFYLTAEVRTGPTPDQIGVHSPAVDFRLIFPRSEVHGQFSDRLPFDPKEVDPCDLVRVTDFDPQITSLLMKVPREPAVTAPYCVWRT